MKKGFGLMETTVFVQTSEMGQILTKTVLLFIDPYTAKLCFSGVLKHFCRNLQKNLFLRTKNDHLRRKLRIPQREMFSQRV